MEQQIDFIYNIHRTMRDNNVLLAFTGEFDMKIINALITSVKLKLKEVEHVARVQKRVYSIMVECLESILHSYDDAQKKSKNLNPFSVFTLSFDKDNYYLISGNYVLNDRIDYHKTQIDKINKLTIEDKKQLYREYITDSSTAEYSTDLAMVDMAIKSNNTLTYEFRKVDELTSFYIFQVKIKTN
jgi:hypothetical protein